MNESAKSFIKWIGGILATVIAGFLLWWLTNDHHKSDPVPVNTSGETNQQSQYPNTASGKEDAAKTSSTVIPDKPGPEKDVFKIVSILPPVNTVLPSSAPFQITLRIHYKLVTAESALFVPYLEEFADADLCASGSHHTIGTSTPDRISISRGEADINVKITYDPDIDSKNNGNGIGHVSPNASLWAGFDSQGRVIVMQAGLWDFKDFCYTFRP